MVGRKCKLSRENREASLSKVMEGLPVTEAESHLPLPAFQNTSQAQFQWGSPWGRIEGQNQLIPRVAKLSLGHNATPLGGCQSFACESVVTDKNRPAFGLENPTQNFASFSTISQITPTVTVVISIVKEVRTSSHGRFSSSTPSSSQD